MADTEGSSTQFFHHGRFQVKGGVIPDAITAYRTYGDPRNPCVIFPTSYGCRLDGQLHMIGSGKLLDPARFFVVTLALFSNGESSSPSNTPSPYNGVYFPAVSYEDNIRAQYAVLTKHLGITKLHMVIGFSMGGQQAYYWAVMYPEFIDNFVAICGSARTSVHNQCFIEGPKAALLASKDFDNGHYKSQPYQGLRAFGRVYCGWAYGQTFYRKELFKECGYPTLESFMKEAWEQWFLEWDANDVLTLIDTWRNGDVSLVRDNGSFEHCLASIKPRGLIMPCKTDLYFPPEDSEIEIASLKEQCKLVVIDSVWGHMAGGGPSHNDNLFIKSEVEKFLAGQ